MNVACYGYRNLQDFIFRDETKTIMQGIGIQAPVQTAVSSSATRDRLGMITPSPDILVAQHFRQALELKSHPRQAEIDPYLEQLVQPSEDDTAISYFFSRFVISDGRSSPIPMGFVPYIIQTGADTLLSTAIVSVGMAALANVSGSPSRALAARQKYIYSLSLTRVALDDLSLVHADAVFMAVLLLAMFEVSLLRIYPTLTSVLD